ncbi:MULTISPECIES: DUF3558 family protein [Streptomyces]|uniref:DUF3558 domain-containing protein n=1 Tax=Streptomyces dengpaensis TaxID=2049881 RepID=A0ABM6SRM0_9ACTN|nr:MULTISPECIES: DUF3558 family protein [Streptomyces]AVH57244.1 DUF3558 domain-containing protein [Streptomyces dengpaensis]PIB03726.1 DUF3558 domain-containing protein [Streptomyces sp. HG99]
MSEGTMHRPAQRVGRAPRLTRILVSAAAVPVMLVAAGCSSDSGSGDDKKSAGSSPDAKASASASANAIEPAAYSTLPEPCSVLSKKTLGELVPKGAKSGKEGKSDDVAARGNCNWSSLDNNGVKGSQFRWLNVALLRFESDSRGDGNEQAHAYFEKQVTGAQSVTGAKKTESEPVSGTGDEATAVSYDLKKKEGSFKQQTVVARVENVVVTLDYNGAGLAGEKTPSAADLLKAAEKAAKEAMAAVSAANEDEGGSGAKASTPPSASKSASPSKSAAEKS